MSMTGDQGSGDVESADSSKVFGTKPYLDKQGREILNRAARRVQKSDPDWVNDPDDPSTSDVLVYLQQNSDGFTDSGLLVELLGNGLNAEEVICWVLWKHSDLEPREIFYAHEGKQTSGRAGVDDQAIRNIESRIRSAGRKLGVDPDL